MGLSHRLRRLEASASASSPRPCAACGATLGEPERFVLAPIDLDERRPLPGPERCAGCGRRLIVRLGPITVDDAGGAP